jgi:putative ABC transport system substrate-binding protein
MRRRELLLLLLATGTVGARGLHAQQKAMPVVGWLSGVSPSAYAPFVAAFREGLREAGYVEGQNLSVEYRWAEGHYDWLPAMAANLVGRNVDVITATGGFNSPMAAKNATSTIPIVFTGGFDPVASGLVASLARPGGNLTGVSWLSYDLMPKRLELLAELVPRTAVIALLVNPANDAYSSPLVISAVQAAAHAKGVHLPVLKAGTADDFEGAFASLAQLQAGALLVGNDAFFVSRREQLVALAAHYAVPAIYEVRSFVDAGGLISYGTSLTGVYRQLGRYVAEILNGAKPADLPVQQPTRFELVVNLKAAEALGLKVPPTILARADEVIE